MPNHSSTIVFTQFVEVVNSGIQASARSGVLDCRYEGDRTDLSERAVLFTESEICCGI